MIDIKGGLGARVLGPFSPSRSLPSFDNGSTSHFDSLSAYKGTESIAHSVCDEGCCEGGLERDRPSDRVEGERLYNGDDELSRHDICRVVLEKEGPDEPERGMGDEGPHSSREGSSPESYLLRSASAGVMDGTSPFDYRRFITERPMTSITKETSNAGFDRLDGAAMQPESPPDVV